MVFTPSDTWATKVPDDVYFTFTLALVIAIGISLFF